MSDAQQYRYDVFISYSQDDHEWVWEWLLPRLEAAGLTVCLDDGCFELGAPKAEETERVVRESRRTLVILSPGLVASQWDQFEALLVHAQDPAASGRRLIPLLLEPCDPPERIKLLQWVDFSDAARQEAQLERVINAIQGKGVLPELRPEEAFPSPKQRRWELRWFAVAGVAAVLTLILVGLLLWNSMPKKAVTMPASDFNIAVAPFEVFDSQGKPVDDNTGYQQSASIARFLRSEAVALTEVYGSQFGQQVNIWGVDELKIPVVTDANAEAVLKQLNARVLIYGSVTQETTDKLRLDPYLYFSDESVEQLAAELRGPQAMGEPVTYYSDLSGNPNLVLGKRMSALAHVLLGLVLFEKGDRDAYEGATAAFEAGTKTEWGQQSGEGQEILYLFLGNAYSSYAAFVEEEDPVRRKALIEMGLEQFKKALSLNPDYPRAYNGLAFTLFQAARPSLEGDDCDWDWDKLAEAYDDHQLARRTVSETNSGDVEFRARWGMGLVRYFQGLCPNPPEWNANIDPWTEAQDHFDFVLQEYENNPAKSRILPAASTHAHIGHIWLDSAEFELCLGELPKTDIGSYLDQAIGQYEQAETTARLLDNQETRLLSDELPRFVKEAKCFRDNLSEPDIFAQCYPGEGDPCP